MLDTISVRASERGHLLSENSDKPSDISDAMRLVRLAAGPRKVEDSIKRAVRRAADELGWSFTRTRDIWYGTARRLEVCEMDALRALEQRADNAAEYAERRRHIEQLAALRARLQFNDPDFHAADIAAISWIVDAMR